MKKKPPMPNRRLPVDFGNETPPETPSVVPIRRAAFPFHRKPRKAEDVNFGHFQNTPGPLASPFPGGEGWGEGEFKTSFVVFPSALRRRGFTLVEILVVLALLSLIVYALMAVFSTTQRAFRASITQTDTLEGGRAVMDLIASDLETMAPSDGVSNASLVNGGTALEVGYGTPVNFASLVKIFPAYPPSPLVQPLIGSPSGVMRTNVLEDIFILSKGNINGLPSWIGTGYSVNTNLADGTLYPLYRFYMTTNVASGSFGQYFLYTNFAYFNYTNTATWSHLMDGVVQLTTRCYDTNGVWLTNGFANPLSASVPHNVNYIGSPYSEPTCYFFSNALPASVLIQMGTLEDRTLQHAESLNGAAQSNFLANSAANLHLFNKRVWIRNVDPSAYQ